MRTRRSKRRHAISAKEFYGRPTHNRGVPSTSEEPVPPTQGEGSELNNVSGGSPSSGESPLSRKKPRMEETEVYEITIETNEPELQTKEEERRVVYFSQYLCISLWRALKSCDIWDCQLVAAVCQGPKTFTDTVTEFAKRVHHRLENIQPEAFVHAYLAKLRPAGLYSSCAKLLQKANAAKFVNSLKRKKPERKEQNQQKDETEGDVDEDKHVDVDDVDDDDDDDNLSFLAVDDGQYKHRFIMDQPRLIIINGPQKELSF